MDPTAEIDFEQFAAVDMRVGRVTEVEDFPEARKPAWKLRIDFGPEIGEKRSSAQITNYTREELLGTSVVAVVNFPPRQIGPVRSEVLVLGALDDAGVRRPAPPRPRRRAGRPNRLTRQSRHKIGTESAHPCLVRYQRCSHARSHGSVVADRGRQGVRIRNEAGG